MPRPSPAKRRRLKLTHDQANRPIYFLCEQSGMPPELDSPKTTTSQDSANPQIAFIESAQEIVTMPDWSTSCRQSSDTAFARTLHGRMGWEAGGAYQMDLDRHGTMVPQTSIE